MRTVLDTSVVIARGLDVLPGELAISTATIAELSFGVLVAKSPSDRAFRLRRLSRLQRQFDPLPVDDAVAVSYGEMAAAVARVGRNPRPRAMDLLIAATAHAHDAQLYTRNLDDFTGLEDLIEVVGV